MRVLLTGGSGSVGKAVIDRMVKQGYSVLVIGRREGMSFEGADYASCDINDYPRLREVIHGCSAVIHLAAIPNPGAGTPEQVFASNAQGTFNVFQAAAEEGIKRVVQASSINATGQFYGLKPHPLNYLPIDEEHDNSQSTDTYSFSKHVIEEIGEYFWRREGISSVALRLPWVAPAEQHEKMAVRTGPLLPIVDILLKKSPEERLVWFESSWAAYNAFRANRPYETKGLAMQLITAMPDEQRDALRAMSNRVNFFTMLDERDSAQAMEKGITADYSGAHTLFINDSHNWSGIESSILAELFYPDVKTFRKPLVGTETLVSIDRARQLIGFEPEFTFDQGK